MRDRPAEPPPKPVISPPNTLTLSQIITGCKVYVERTIRPDRPDETEVRKAEILSIRERKLGRAERKERKARIRAAQDDAAAEAQRRQLEEEEEKARSVGDRLEYYCHYVEFNKVSLAALPDLLATDLRRARQPATSYASMVLRHSILTQSLTASRRMGRRVQDSPVPRG